MPRKVLHRGRYLLLLIWRNLDAQTAEQTKSKLSWLMCTRNDSIDDERTMMIRMFMSTLTSTIASRVCIISLFVFMQFPIRMLTSYDIDILSQRQRPFLGLKRILNTALVRTPWPVSRRTDWFLVDSSCPFYYWWVAIWWSKVPKFPRMGLNSFSTYSIWAPPSSTVS